MLYLAYLKTYMNMYLCQSLIKDTLVLNYGQKLCKLIST